MQNLLGQAIYDYALEQENGSVFINNKHIQQLCKA